LLPIRHKEGNSSQHYQHPMVLQPFKDTNIVTRVSAELDSSISTQDTVNK